MNEALTLLMVFGVGVVLGTVFFGGLWWTIHKGASSSRPETWFLGSLLVRMSVVLIGFYLAAGHHWERLLLCLLGFILARLVVTQYTGGLAKRPVHPSQEARHAP